MGVATASVRFAFALTLASLAGLLGTVAQSEPSYVGSDTCTDCHTEAAEAWAGSHHAKAWTEVSPDTVVADFDGTSFTLGDMTARFRVEPDGSLAVAVTEEDGVTTDYPIHSVVGIEPLQQYLIETEEGRLQSFDVVWDTERRDWFHLYADQNLPPDDGLHWTGPYKNWNARCAECHATGFDKGYDPVTGTYASTHSEIGVGCEACHGPGEAHLAWVEGAAIADSGADLNAYGFSMTFDSAEAAIQQCAGCHSRREAHGTGNPLPGTPYHDAYSVAQLRPGLYHSDGQILDEVYVYGSFIQSKMYAKGVGCLDCHDAHTARRITTGNAVCTQCHSLAGNPRFETLPLALYDDPSHHRHSDQSDGAQCVACHMIERTYMGVDGRRDHSFRVPRPDLAAETGAPDACTDCHADRSPAWAASILDEWFPESRHRGRHYGVALARGRADPGAVVGDLGALAGDPASPGLARATAMWLLEQSGNADMADELAPFLEDPDPLLRAATASLQRNAEPQERVLRLLPILNDPVRSVRIAAARTLVDAPIARLPRATQAALDRAMRDWQGSLAARLDFPETHLQLGGMALVQRNVPAAEAAFRKVVQLDPQRVEAWTMLVRIAVAMEGPDRGLEVTEEALEIIPDDAGLKAIAEQIRNAQQ